MIQSVLNQNGLDLPNKRNSQRKLSTTTEILKQADSITGKLSDFTENKGNDLNKNESHEKPNFKIVGNSRRSSLGIDQLFLKKQKKS